jgi:predicted MFS family arabinose efflux permease
LTANPRRLVLLSGLEFVLFPIPIITLFYRDQIGMSITDIMVLQAVFGMAAVLCEFPSGYFADRVGYRTSLITGTTLGVIGWIVYALAETFGVILIAEIMLGAAHAFVSGADRALLWVSLESTGRAEQYTRWESRGRAAGQTAEAVTSALGGWLYALAPRLPFWLQVPAAALALAVAGSLRETPRLPSADHGSHLRRALHVLRFTLWHHARLRAAMALSVALGLGTFVIVWLIQPYMQARGVPTAWFGLLWAAAHVWLVGVSLSSARLVTAFGTRAPLVACCALVPLAYAGLAASASAWGLVFYLGFMTVRGLQGPILITVMQRDAPDEDRASVPSINALLFRLAFVIVGPPVGMLVDRLGMESALWVLAGAFAVIGFGALVVFTRAHKEPVTL